MRRVVYVESRKLRLKVIDSKDYVEPSTLGEIPVLEPVPQISLPYQHAVKSGARATFGVCTARCRYVCCRAKFNQGLFEPSSCLVKVTSCFNLGQNL